MYKINKEVFEKVTEDMILDYGTSVVGLCRILGYNSTRAYYHAMKHGEASEKLIKRMHHKGADVSEFMKRDDFIHLFGNE